MEKKKSIFMNKAIDDVCSNTLHLTSMNQHLCIVSSSNMSKMTFYKVQWKTGLIWSIAYSINTAPSRWKNTTKLNRGVGPSCISIQEHTFSVGYNLLILH